METDLPIVQIFASTTYSVVVIDLVYETAH
jgi:hypothetical protein